MKVKNMITRFWKMKIRKFLISLLLASATLACVTACVKHTHSYTESVTAPTCIEKGFTTHTCECGDSYISAETEALGHTFNQKIIAEEYLNTPAEGETLATYFYSCHCGEKSTEFFYYGTHNVHTYDLKFKTDEYLQSAVTCETPASYYYACACGEKGSTTYTDGTALGHTLVIDEAVPATCKNGLTSGNHCETCNKVFKEQEIIEAVDPHQFTDKVCDVCEKNVEDLAYTFYDISANSDNSLMAYLVENKSYFDIYIVGSGACMDYYNSPFYMNGYAEKIQTVTISKGITNIGNSLFSNCNIPTITFPESLKTIGDYAFASCNLSTITFPESLKTIRAYAFAYSNLTTITLPENLKTIEGYAFKNCSNLATINLGDNLMTIGYESFENTAYKNNLDNWNNDVLYIDNYIISAQTSLTKITIGKDIRGIADYAFSYCSSLTSVSFEEESKCAFIGSSSFEHCAALSSITFPNGLISIGHFAFQICSSLTSIKIPDSVTSIGNFAFSGCLQLRSITVSQNLTSIGFHAFYDCRKLNRIKLPKSLTSIGEYAFHSCYNLTIYCEATSKPSGWSEDWNYCVDHKNNTNYCTVVWGYNSN